MVLPRIIGNTYEKIAAQYLKQQGLALLTRNYTCRLGEIDLIMTQNDLLIFIEVRARNTQGFGSAIETVHLQKQRKIIRATKHFLQHHPKIFYNAIRFDVVGIQHNTQNEPPTLQWVKNAFFME